MEKCVPANFTRSRQGRLLAVVPVQREGGGRAKRKREERGGKEGKERVKERGRETGRREKETSGRRSLRGGRKKPSLLQLRERRNTTRV